MSVTTFGYKQLYLSNGPHHPLPAKNLNIEGIRMMGTASSLDQQNPLGLKHGSKVIKALQKWIKTQWTWTEVGIFASLLEWIYHLYGTFVTQRFLLRFQVLHHWFSARKHMAQRVTKWFKEYASKTCLLRESFEDIFSLENFQFQILLDEILKVRKQLHCRTGRWTPPAAKNHSLRPLSNRFIAKIRMQSFIYTLQNTNVFEGYCIWLYHAIYQYIWLSVNNRRRLQYHIDPLNLRQIVISDTSLSHSSARALSWLTGTTRQKPCSSSTPSETGDLYSTLSCWKKILDKPRLTCVSWLLASSTWNWSHTSSNPGCQVVSWR